MNPMDSHSLWMLHPDLPAAPRVSMPPGYAMRFYRSGADVDAWVRIQIASDPFFTPTEDNFASSFPGDDALRSQRIMFLVDLANGHDIGTIAAWNNAELTGSDIGQIHWVAIMPDYQGRGLAKPMLSAANDRLLALGYTQAWLETASARIPALNLYLWNGFMPFSRNDNERAVWQAVAPLLKYPAPGGATT